MPKPERIDYIAKLFHRKDGDPLREVVSFDRGVKQDDGEWKNIKPSFIQYEDGVRVELGGPVTLKYLPDPKGNHFANVYIARWPKKEEGGDDIPF